MQRLSQVVVRLRSVKVESRGKLPLLFGILVAVFGEEVNWKIWNSVGKGKLLSTGEMFERVLKEGGKKYCCDTKGQVCIGGVPLFSSIKVFMRTFCFVDRSNHDGCKSRQVSELLNVFFVCLFFQSQNPMIGLTGPRDQNALFECVRHVGKKKKKWLP